MDAQTKTVQDGASSTLAMVSHIGAGDMGEGGVTKTLNLTTLRGRG